MCLFFLFLFESFFSLNQVLKKKDYFILEYFEKEIYAGNIFSIRRKFGRTWKSSFKIDQLFYFSPREKEISIKEEETSQDWNGVYIYIYITWSRERFGYPFLPKNLIRCEGRYIKSIQMFLHLTLTIIEYLRDLILSLFSMIYNLLLLLFTFILISFYLQFIYFTFTNTLRSFTSAMKIKFNFVFVFFSSRILSENY